MPTGDDRTPDEGGDRAVRHFTVHHDGVTIPVSRGGRGRPLVLCPGLNSTQADLHELTELLRRDHDVVTFDLRGHGPASASDRYSFDAFLSDLVAVLAELGRRGLSSAPVLVGYSLGADLAVHYAAESPETVAGLLLIDGANPLPEPFITEADLADSRTMANAQNRLDKPAHPNGPDSVALLCGAAANTDGCCLRRMATRTANRGRSGARVPCCQDSNAGTPTRPVSLMMRSTVSVRVLSPVMTVSKSPGSRSSSRYQSRSWNSPTSLAIGLVA